MKPRFTLAIALLTCSLSYGTAFAAGALNDEAQKHFDAGLAYADDPGGPKWYEALKEFQAAYAISPTWKLKNNIGLCALNLERDGEAIEAYKEYLAHGGEKNLSAKQRKQIEKDIAMLSASLVKVELEVEPADAVIVDERRNEKGELRVNRYPVQSGKASIGIHPGAHKITIEAPGYESASWSFEAPPGSKHERSFKLETEKKAEASAPPAAREEQPSEPLPSEAPKPEHHTPVGVYIGLAATGVFAAAATTTGVLALGKQKDYDDAKTVGDRSDARDSGKMFALITDIGIGAAVVSAGITTYLYFSSKSAAKSEKVGVTVSPVATPSTAGLSLSGRF